MHIPHFISKNQKTQMPMVMASSSYRPYDVLISFSRRDTFDGFTSHLHSALGRNHFRTYIEDKDRSGNNISKKLGKAMDESNLFLVVFSENYANSRRCLDELVEIMGCSRRNRQVVVVPVFYRIQPSHVRNQTGSYGTAFERHDSGYSDRRIQSWKKALFQAAKLSGFHATEHRY